MLFAIRTIQERTGKDLGATFLSGTTISNSLTELYLSLIHIFIIPIAFRLNTYHAHVFRTWLVGKALSKEKRQAYVMFCLLYTSRCV